MMTTETTSHDAKEKILDYIDDRLREWAEWALSGYRLGISYPPCSVEYRLMAEGHVERGYQGLVPMPEHAEAEAIEKLLCEMGMQHRKMAEVIRVYYFDRDSILHKAKRSHLSDTRFKTYLTAGRWWLAGRLSDQIAVKKLMQKANSMQNNTLKLE